MDCVGAVMVDNVAPLRVAVVEDWATGVTGRPV